MMQLLIQTMKRLRGVSAGSKASSFADLLPWSLLPWKDNDVEEVLQN